MAGRNLRTYIDVELQQLAEKLLTKKTGAIVALDPKTGGILAMASGPDYDPNDLTAPNKKKNYGRMSLDVSKPLYNRAIKVAIPGGSTYKPLGALIALEEGLLLLQQVILAEEFIMDVKENRNVRRSGLVMAANLRLAIAWSCNSFFSEILKRTIDNPNYRIQEKGLTKWKEYCTAFGYGHRLGVDLVSEDGGNIPDTSAYDKEYRHQWNSCTMVGGGLGIGQDKMLVTPLQIANAISIVANKGYYYTPHFVKSIDGETDADSTW